MELDILNHMLNNEALNAQINNRLYPSELPQTPILPAVTYNTISKPRPIMGNQFYRIQYDVYANTYAQAKQVAGLVEMAAMGSTVIDGLHTVYIDNHQDAYDSTKKRNHVIIDVIFYCLESTEFEQ